jgi:hypothetical protein
VEAHIVGCREWARVYRDSPEIALDASAEYERWQREDKPGERAAAVQARVEATDDARRVMAGRFAKKDPLGGDGDP